MPHVSRDRYGNIQRGGYRDDRHGRGGYGDDRHGRGGYGDDHGRDGYGGGWQDRGMPSGRRLIRVFGRFVLIAAIILVPIVILLIIGAVLLIMWLFGNAGPLTGALDGIGQALNQLSKIAGIFGGG